MATVNIGLKLKNAIFFFVNNIIVGKEWGTYILDTGDRDMIITILRGIQNEKIESDISVDVLLGYLGGGSGEGGTGTVGPQGPMGPAGPKGDKGDTGARGASGLQGPIGPQGPQGPAGKDGSQGLQGIQGIQGLDGAKGDKGDAGPAGIQGLKGEKGEQGPEGSNGVPGDSALDLYRAENDDPELTFQDMLNSLRGEPGAQGSEGPAGADGVDGSDGADGENGLDGKSAYEVWLSLGNTGSEQDFITSLKGEPGSRAIDLFAEFTKDYTDEELDKVFYIYTVRSLVASTEANTQDFDPVEWSSDFRNMWATKNLTEKRLTAEFYSLSRGGINLYQVLTQGGENGVVTVLSLSELVNFLNLGLPQNSLARQVLIDYGIEIDAPVVSEPSEPPAA